MKRVLSIFLIAALALTLSACGKVKKPEQVTEIPAAAPKPETQTQTAAPAPAPETPAPETPAQSGGPITADDAKGIALADVGASEGDVDKLRVKQDDEKGRTVYEVEFRFGDSKYDYEIDAAAGEITELSVEFQGKLPDGAGDVGEDAAVDAALAHAGVKKEQAGDLRVKPDKEDGRQIYEVEFRCESVKYDYDVDAATGFIVEWERSLKIK